MAWAAMAVPQLANPVRMRAYSWTMPNAAFALVSCTSPSQLRAATLSAVLAGFAWGTTAPAAAPCAERWGAGQAASFSPHAFQPEPCTVPRPALQILHVGAELPVTVAFANLLAKAFPDDYAARRREEAAAINPPDETLLPLFVMSLLLPQETVALNIFEPRSAQMHVEMRICTSTTLDSPRPTPGDLGASAGTACSCAAAWLATAASAWPRWVPTASCSRCATSPERYSPGCVNT